MKEQVFCENIFNDVLPSVRAIIASRLTGDYKLTQSQVSEKLGLTQPAVSQYTNGLRGKGVKRILENKGMLDYLDSLSAEIVNRDVDLNFKVCEICEKSRKEGVFKKASRVICLLDIAGTK